jgi:hypothetical protein
MTGPTLANGRLSAQDGNRQIDGRLASAKRDRHIASGPPLASAGLMFYSECRLGLLNLAGGGVLVDFC